MDRNRINALRNRAFAIDSLIAPTQALLAELTSEHPTAHISARIGIEAGPFESVHLIDPKAITWPTGLFVQVACAEAHTDLQRFIETALPIRQLYHDSAKAASFFGSLFSTTANQQAVEAAQELETRLTDPILSELEHAVKNHLETAHVARQLQTSGVQLFPGVHGYPDTYITAARQALTRELGLAEDYTPSFDTLDRNYITPTHNLVKELNIDQFAKPKLAAVATEYLSAMRTKQAEQLIAQMPVEHLKTVTNERLRFAGLDTIGVTTVKNVLDKPLTTLTQVPGLGIQTAKRMKAAAQTLLSEAQLGTNRHIGTDPTPEAMNLVGALHLYELTDTLSIEQRTRRDRLTEYFAEFPGYLDPLGSPFLVIKEGEICYNQFLDDIAWAVAAPDTLRPHVPSHLKGATATAAATTIAAEAWADYLTRPAHYQALLESLTGDTTTTTTTAGLSKTTIDAIRTLQLNDNLLTNLFLRGYQNFGAKFIIVQQKTILGDEMGLGKTVQALAAAAHIAATTEKARILIVVPASLIINWRRETEKFTKLPVHIAHGELKTEATASWAETGGVLILTYDGARTMTIPTPTMVIIDEAHMIKNPKAKRSQAVAKLINKATYAVLMTGTPMENRVTEFGQLVSYVQPELIPTQQKGTVTRPSQFRQTVAPAYLRRNQTDVLDELPEKVENLDWVTLSDTDNNNYRTAISDGNWMAARRAAMMAPPPLSAKIERIREIIHEAESENKNILIFSYFRDVLENLNTEFAEKSVGIINGDVPPQQRQLLVDALGTTGNILLAQIGAGGVGLNIQSAQVVILTEIQIKPSLEDQAIARAHRMGQTGVVHVHRIIGDDTVDERLLEVTAEKRKLFDQYARESEAAEIHDAVDISEAQLAAAIIANERKRLGITTTPTTF